MYTKEIQNTVQQDFWNETTQKIEDRPAQEISDEQNALIESTRQDIQSQVDAYKAAQEHQKDTHGPGPVATYEIMKICNEHNGQFQVVFQS